jgi:hypothetical protein
MLCFESERVASMFFMWKTKTMDYVKKILIDTVVQGVS